MKKNIILIIIAVTVLILVIINAVKLIDNTDVYRTEQPVIRDITKRLMIDGNVYPCQEIEIKSSISGVLDKVYVEIGEHVNKGDKIAEIKLTPSPTQIESYKHSLNIAKIEYQNAAETYEREKQLYESNVIPKLEYDRYVNDLNLKKEKLESAVNQLELLEGRGNVNSSNMVFTSTEGVILDIPIDIGTSVIERNNFNIGTTIVIVGDISNYIFKGKINEIDIPHFKIGDTIL